MCRFPRSNPLQLLLFCNITASTVAHGPAPNNFQLGDAIAAPTATIDAGIVIGKASILPAALAPVNQFLGIPFAQSPPQRFSPPRSPSPFLQPINATEWKPACMQQFKYPLESAAISRELFNTPAPIESEDCLYINVYAPAGKPAGAGRAVLFWIFGGSLQIGHAGQTSYDGSVFASYEDVIVVAPNYRTNVFGFPNSPELPLAERNLGYLDQRFALDWVQRNIHAFGGDPAKVTIFGESAGGFSIDSLLTSYPRDSSPPFRAAILQSGQFTYRSAPASANTVFWNNLTAELRCPGHFGSNLTCVRAADAVAIQNIINENRLTFYPDFDNVTFVSDPGQRRLSGNIAFIPVLGGTNSQEGRVFHLRQNNLTEYLQTIFGASPDLIPAIRAAYPNVTANVTSDYDVISEISGELTFLCPQALWANATAATGIPTWRYLFNASFTNTQGRPGLGAYHSSEIPLVFRTYNLANSTTQQYALGQSMQSAWAKFAKNPYAGPGWNAVGTGTAGTILSGTKDRVSGGLLLDRNMTIQTGDWNLAVFGDVGDVRGSGITVLPQSEFDARCSLFRSMFEDVMGLDGMPPNF